MSYDFAVPYNICGGAQDNGSWCGPSKRKQAVNNSYWYTIAGGDGFYTAQDPTDPNIVYAESQGGNASRLNVKTGERTNLRKPSWQARYKYWEDSIASLRGDPLKPETKEITKALVPLRAAQKADSIDRALRFNWNAPFFLSPHNPEVFYFGGNRLLKSTKRGDDLYIISPDLSKKNQAKLDTSLIYTGGITLDATGAETYGTIVDSPNRTSSRGCSSLARTTATSGRAPTTVRRGRIFSAQIASRGCRRVTSTSRASSRRTSIRLHSTWPSKGIARTISRRTSTPRPTAARRSRRSSTTCRRTARPTSCT